MGVIKVAEVGPERLAAVRRAVRSLVAGGFHPSARLVAGEAGVPRESARLCLRWLAEHEGLAAAPKRRPKNHSAASHCPDSFRPVLEARIAAHRERVERETREAGRA